MAIPTPLRFSGAPGSPYTRKMLALLRFRRLPHHFLILDEESRRDLPQPKVRLLPTFYLPRAGDGELEAVVDSTPLIRRFEALHQERPVVPRDPVVAFVDYLVEDYADEWLTKAMFHYRWSYEADIEKAGEILSRWRAVTASQAQIEKAKKAVQERQISRLWVVGSNATTAPVIEASYQRFLGIFRRILERQPFLMGERPGASDFGVYGQLTQLVKFDPTPMAIALAEAPGVYAWVDVVDDLSGLEVAADGWIAREALGDRLGELLCELGRVYAPFLVANAEALERGAEKVETTIDGRPWVQRPFPYQGKCLRWLRERYESLDADDRAAVDTVLAGTGCEPLIA